MLPERATLPKRKARLNRSQTLILASSVSSCSVSGPYAGKWTGISKVEGNVAPDPEALVGSDHRLAHSAFKGCDGDYLAHG